MIAALLLASALASGEVDIRIAPDHPLRVVYDDEPLTLQIKSSEPHRVRGIIDIRDLHDHQHVEVLRSFALNPGQPFLQAIEAFDNALGYYTAHIVIQTSSGTYEERQNFCRLKRPNPQINPRLAVAVPQLDQATLLALNAIPIREVWIEASSPALRESMALAKRSGVRVTLRFRDGQEENTLRRAQLLGKSHGSDVAAWVIDTPGPPARHNQLADALTSAARRPVIAAVRDTAALKSVLEPGQALHAQEFALRPAGPGDRVLDDARKIAERSGLEQPRFVVEHPDRPETGPGRSLIQALLTHASAGVRLTVLPLNALIDGGQLTSTAVYLHAYAAQLDQSEYVGPLPLGEGNFAAMFRENASWRLTYWTEHEKKSMRMRPGNAESIALTDGWNNPVGIDTSEDGRILLSIDSEPRYLAGRGGVVLAQAASIAMKGELDTLVTTPQNTEQLPPELMDLLKQERNARSQSLSRTATLTLLQSFPYLEKQSRDDIIDDSVAVPAMASLTRLLEAAFILEQEQGKPFLESPSAALTRCNQFRTEYVTNIADRNAQSPRAQWLLAEIGRLQQKAGALENADRRTEATGIAKLAEWRARSLEYAPRAGE
jgi:hypothetical protein